MYVLGSYGSLYFGLRFKYLLVGFVFLFLLFYEHIFISIFVEPDYTLIVVVGMDGFDLSSPWFELESTLVTNP